MGDGACIFFFPHNSRQMFDAGRLQLKTPAIFHPAVAAAGQKQPAKRSSRSERRRAGQRRCANLPMGILRNLCSTHPPVRRANSRRGCCSLELIIIVSTTPWAAQLGRHTRASWASAVFVNQQTYTHKNKHESAKNRKKKRDRWIDFLAFFPKQKIQRRRARRKKKATDTSTPCGDESAPRLGPRQTFCRPRKVVRVLRARRSLVELCEAQGSNT